MLDRRLECYLDFALVKSLAFLKEYWLDYMMELMKDDCLVKLMDSLMVIL